MYLQPYFLLSMSHSIFIGSRDYSFFGGGSGEGQRGGEVVVLLSRAIDHLCDFVAVSPLSTSLSLPVGKETTVAAT